MTHSFGISSAGRRTIVPPRQVHSAALPNGGVAQALREATRLENLARACRASLLRSDPNGVRRTVGLALDALEAIESGLAQEFPPTDPGRPADRPPSEGPPSIATAPLRPAGDQRREVDRGGLPEPPGAAGGDR